MKYRIKSTNQTFESKEDLKRHLNVSLDNEKEFEDKINMGSSFEFMGEFIEIVMDQEQDALSLDKKVEEIKQQEKKELPIFSMEKPRRTTQKMKSQGMKL